MVKKVNNYDEFISEVKLMLEGNKTDQELEEFIYTNLSVLPEDLQTQLVGERISQALAEEAENLKLEVEATNTALEVLTKFKELKELLEAKGRLK